MPHRAVRNPATRFCFAGLWVLALVSAVGLARLGAAEPPAPPAPAPDNPAAWAEENFSQGHYRESLAFFRKALAATAEGTPERLKATVRLASVLRLVSEYPEALKVLEDALRANPRDLPLARLHAEVLSDVGRYEEALKSFDAVVQADPQDQRAWALRKQVGLLLGRKELVKQTQDHFFDLFNSRADDYYNGKVADAMEPAYVGLGIWEANPKDAFKNGFGVAEDLIQTRKLRDPEVFLWAAELAAEKYHFNFAIEHYQRALRIQPRLPDALAGLAQVTLVHPPPGRDPTETAQKMLEQVFESAPNHVEGHLTQAVICLQEDKFEEARKHIDAALAVNPNHFHALALLAFYHHELKQEAQEAAVEKRVLALNPHYADYYCTLGELIESKRNFVEAPKYYRKAIEADPDYWRGYYGLGMNTSRLGGPFEEEGRKLLEKAFAMNRFNYWAKNMLSALDKILGDPAQHVEPVYAQSQTKHFTLKYHQKEATILRPYVEEFAEAAYERQSQLFGFEPQGPLTIEVCFNFDDQSARTVGVPNLGALGVCFGKLCTIVSPREGREGGQNPPFNWRRVLEHEFCHVMTLQQSAFRIPRWYTEGWSVYMEDDSRLESDRMMVNALAKGQVKPLEKMEDYFRGNMLMAYIHGRYVVQYLVEKYGLGAQKKAFRMFAEGKKLEEVLPAVTGKSLKELNAEQFAYLRDVYKQVRLRPVYDQADLARLESAADAPDASAQALADLAMAHLALRRAGQAETEAQRALKKDPVCADALNILGRLSYQNKDYENAKVFFEGSTKADPVKSFVAWQHLGLIYSKEGRTTKAVEALEKARTLYPRYNGPAEENPHHLLPALYLDLEPPQEAKALAAWEEAVKANTADYEAARAGLKLAMKLKDWPRAAAFALAFIEVDPYKVEIHRLAGRAYQELKDLPRAAREYSVATQLDEKDVESWVKLARVELALGHRDEARKAAAAALEVDATHAEAKALRDELKF